MSYDILCVLLKHQYFVYVYVYMCICGVWCMVYARGKLIGGSS